MKKLCFLIMLFQGILASAQVKIGGTGEANAAAVLELDGGGNKGLLIPKLTQAQRAAIQSPPQGLLVFQTDGVVGFYVNRSTLPFITNWSMLGEGTNYWLPSNNNVNDIINVNPGNVGIGSSLPIRAGLVVDRKVGAAHAMFGSFSTGIAIESSYPGIGFNTYYSGGRRYMTSGYGGYIGVDPIQGQFSIIMSDSNSTALGSNFTTDRLRLRILKNGNIGVEGNDNPQAPLSFAAVTGKKISLYRGTSGDAGFGVFGNELRINSDYNGANITFGYDNLTNGFTEKMRLTGDGSLGIGTNAPGSKLDVISDFANDGIRVGTASQKVVMKPGAFGGIVGTSTNNSFHLMASNGIAATITPAGNTGLGTLSPVYKLDVNGRMRLRHNGVTSGIWFNNSLNVETGFIGQYSDTKIGVYGASGWQFAIDNTDGTVYLGTSNLDNENLAKGAGYKLKVFGKVLAEEVRVQLKAAWPDYVFSKNYKLRPLEEVEEYIKTNNHLPNVPAADEVEKSGIALGEMQSRMMEKIEELTLYVIELKKEIEVLKTKNN